MDILASDAKSSADTTPTQRLDTVPEIVIVEGRDCPEIKVLETQREDSIGSDASPTIEEDGIWGNKGSDIEALETQQRGRIPSAEPIHVDPVVLRLEKELGRIRPESPVRAKAKEKWDPRASAKRIMVPSDEPDVEDPGTQRKDSIRSDASHHFEANTELDVWGSSYIFDGRKVQRGFAPFVPGRGHPAMDQLPHDFAARPHSDAPPNVEANSELDGTRSSAVRKTQQKDTTRLSYASHDVEANNEWVEWGSFGKTEVKKTQQRDSTRSYVSPSVEANNEWAEWGSFAKKKTLQKVSSKRRSKMISNRSADVELLEDRLAQLEERMRKMEQNKDPEPQLEADPQEESARKPEAEAQETVESRRLPAIAEVRYVNWAEFKNRYFFDEDRYAVEVLMAGSNLKEEIRQEQMIRKSGAKVDNTPKIRETLAGKAQFSSQASEQWAHRIRINSLHILSLLAKASGESFADEIQTFFRPYFFLRSFHSNLKEELKELEARWGQTESESPLVEVKSEDALEAAEAGDVAPSATENPESSEQGRPIAHDNTSDGNSLTDSMEALRDLRCYIKFMDTEIIPLEKQFEGTSCRKVRYDDLAYLFSPEDEVFAPVACEISASGFSKPPLVSRYQTLWRLYAINTPEFQYSDLEHDSFSKDFDEKEEGQVKEKTWEPTMYNHFAVWCYYIDFDGKSFGAVRHVHRIRSFEGERDITSLPCYPFRFVENHRDYRRKLRELGEKYQECLSLKHLSYTGSTLICNPTGDRMDDAEGKLLRHPSHVDSEIIIDFEETFQNHPSWRCTFHVPTPGEENIGSNMDNFMLRTWANRQRKDLISAKTEIMHTRDYNRLRNELIKKDTFIVGYKERGQQRLEGDDLILLPRRLFAYILRERKFAQVDVGYTRSATRQIDGFKNLQLPAGHKEMVQALVNIHFKKRNIENLEYGDKLDFDIVKGKGRGLIILLHGVPGVGKTSTAECVAETNKKPLFSITCGDLGFSPAEVESSLSEIFRLAHLWDCVLLLDEADVFLAQRTKQDLNRNALVSVFLRILEYYNGILFLTTNRVGSFDEAFKSRIHMSLYYPPLERDQTIAIWDMNIDRAQKIDAQEVKVTKQLAMVIDRNKLKKFAGRHYDATEQGSGRWNGRQIRNAFQIATALAHHTAERENKERANIYRNAELEEQLPMIAPVLKVDLFKRVADATLHFDKYMTETAGFTDTRLAFEQGDRADHHYFHLGPNTGARNLGKPGSVYNSPGIENYDPLAYGKQARSTGSGHYHGEDDQEGSNYGQAQKTRIPQAYAYAPEEMIERRSVSSSSNLPSQTNYHADGLNQGKAHNPGMFETPTGRYSDNQYNTSSQRRPTPLSANSAQGQYETPTRGSTAGIPNTHDKSAGQFFRPLTAGQDSDSSE